MKIINRERLKEFNEILRDRGSNLRIMEDKQGIYKIKLIDPFVNPEYLSLDISKEFYELLETCFGELSYNNTWTTFWLI